MFSNYVQFYVTLLQIYDFSLIFQWNIKLWIVDVQSEVGTVSSVGVVGGLGCPAMICCWSVGLKMIDNCQLGWVGCAMAQGRLFCKVGFCVSALCALQMCLTWCVGSCRQSHRCLNVCRMSFRVTYNGFGLGEGGDFHHKCWCGEPMFD
jgi:hypothetical protein